MNLSREMSKQQNLKVDHEDIKWVGTPPFCKSESTLQPPGAQMSAG